MVYRDVGAKKDGSDIKKNQPWIGNSTVQRSTLTFFVGGKKTLQLLSVTQTRNRITFYVSGYAVMHVSGINL